jgi:hypothetical protein
VEYEELCEDFFFPRLGEFQDTLIADMITPLLDIIVLQKSESEWEKWARRLKELAFVPSLEIKGKRLYKPCELFEKCSEFSSFFKDAKPFPFGIYDDLNSSKLTALKYLGLKTQVTWQDIKAVVAVAAETDDEDYSKRLLQFLDKNSDRIKDID